MQLTNRDIQLLWAIQSPPLLKLETANNIIWPDSEWFRDLIVPSTVSGWTKSANKRLGFQFEALLATWLMASTQYRLVARNTPLRQANQTIGELDFVVEDLQTGDMEHWEVAVKYYLGVQDLSLSRNWHGPGLKDRLDKKIVRLIDHQLLLSQTKAGMDWLEENNLQIVRCRAWIKGRLFYPWNVAPDCPPEANPRHHRGWWMTAKQFDALSWPNVSLWCHLEKTDWMSDGLQLTGSPTSSWKTWENIDGAMCIAGFNDEGVEVTRGFLVPNSWPKLAQENIT